MRIAPPSDGLYFFPFFSLVGLQTHLLFFLFAFSCAVARLSRTSLTMSDSDSESYEVIDERFSSSARTLHDRKRLLHDQRKSSSRSPVPSDIDFRPPCPVPKSHVVRSAVGLHTNGSTNLTYDRITVSPVVPDYETTSSSSSPPRSNGHSSSETPPPLPPLNAKKRSNNRSFSDSTDNLSSTPPLRSLTLPTSHQNGLSRNTTTNNSIKFSRSNSHSCTDNMEGTINPTYNRPISSSSRTRSGSVESPPVSQASMHPDSYVRDSPEMVLETFASTYKKDLPLQVVVTKGFYGADERTSISERDMFNIHFFKQTKVVKISDTNKYSYTIPLNSSLEFGLVYQLPPGFKQHNAKYHFKTIGDVLQLKTLPKVLRVMASHRGSSPENSVEQNDLLLIKEVKQKRGLKTTRVLKCVHAGSGIKKTLSEDCAGCFSVRPQDVRLFLPEIVEHIELPQSAILYYGGGNRLDLPPHLISSEVSILNMQIEESIVATSILEEEEQQAICTYENVPSIPLVDIPIDLDIEIAVIKLAEQDTDQLYSETRTLLEKYNPSQVSYLNLKSSVTASAQTTLFKAVRQDQNQQIGIEIIRPENAFKTKSENSLNRLSNGSDNSRRQLYTPSECANAEEVHSRIELLESNSTGIENRLNVFELKVQSMERERPDHDGLKKDLISTKSEVSKIRRECEDLRKIVLDTKDHIAKLNSNTEKLARVVDSLQKEFRKSQLEKENSKPVGSYIAMFPAGDTRTGNGVGGSNSSCDEIERANKEFLMTLDPSQICQLLESMNLGAYKDTFQKEQITGEILAELSDQELKDELSVSSKIHRVRIMKLITGRHSASCVLNGEDPYYVHLGQNN